MIDKGFFFFFSLSMLLSPFLANAARWDCYKNKYIVGVTASTGDLNEEFGIYLSDFPNGKSNRYLKSYKATSQQFGKNAYIAAFNALNYQYPIDVETYDCFTDTFLGISQKINIE